MEKVVSGGLWQMMLKQSKKRWTQDESSIYYCNSILFPNDSKQKEYIWVSFQLRRCPQKTGIPNESKAPKHPSDLSGVVKD